MQMAGAQRRCHCGRHFHHSGEVTLPYLTTTGDRVFRTVNENTQQASTLSAEQGLTLSLNVHKFAFMPRVTLPI